MGESLALAVSQIVDARHGTGKASPRPGVMEMLYEW